MEQIEAQRRAAHLTELWLAHQPAVAAYARRRVGQTAADEPASAAAGASAEAVGLACLSLIEAWTDREGSCP